MEKTECHFGDKEECTDKCKYYKTCLWSPYKQDQEKEKK